MKKNSKKEPQSVKSGGSSDHQPSQSSKKVLVVDDDQNLRRLSDFDELSDERRKRCFNCKHALRFLRGEEDAC